MLTKGEFHIPQSYFNINQSLETIFKAIANIVKLNKAIKEVNSSEVFLSFHSGTEAFCK